MGILANGGSHNGKIILSPSAVAKMSEPMTPMSEDLVMSGIETMVGRGVHLLDCPRVGAHINIRCISYFGYPRENVIVYGDEIKYMLCSYYCIAPRRKLSKSHLSLGSQITTASK